METILEIQKNQELQMINIFRELGSCNSDVLILDTNTQEYSKDNLQDGS